MTLSKRPRVVIWSFVILTVILLGLNMGPDYVGIGNRAWKTLTFYKIEIIQFGNPLYDFVSGIEDQKYLLILVSALIGAALIITSKKK